MAPFPSPLERSVASSLILLASTPPKFCLDDDREIATAIRRSKVETFSRSLISGDSGKSCSSAITTSDASREKTRARKIRILELAAHRREKMNLKVARRSRSKTQSTWKPISESSATTASLGSVTTESSCVSSSSTAASRARSQIRSRHVSRSAWYDYKLAMVREQQMMRMKKRPIGSAHMRQRAESILRLLAGGGWLSEMKIRQAIGDSPDTSKALRMLLKLEKVKRSGMGGRHNPFIYTVA